MNTIAQYLSELTAWAGRTSLQACLLIVVILLVQRALGDRLVPRWRSALWLLLLVRLALPWLPESHVSIYNVLPFAGGRATTPGHYETPSPTALTGAGAALHGESAISIPIADAPAQTERAISPTTPVSARRALVAPVATFLPMLLPFAWLAGVLVVLGCAIAQSHALSRAIRRHRFVTDHGTLALLEDCKQESGIHSYLAVVETEHVRSPALFGIIRPRLLLPAGTLATLGREQLRHVFLHELAHLQRHDIAVNWLMTALLALHWFNPLVWYAFARMRADRELACDALALSHARPEESREYGLTFVHLLERYTQPRRLPSLAGVLEKQSDMKRRIAMIARFPQISGLHPAFVGLLFLALGTVTLTGAPTKPPPTSDKAEMMGRVEDFFLHNFRDITSRKSLEWGDLQTETSGTRSIRYMYEAKIWDKDTIIDNRVFVFDRDGKVLSWDNQPGYPKNKQAKVWDPTTTEGMNELVEDFFTRNFRDITERENPEWGEVTKTPDGNYSIRYKYLATIWDKDKKPMDQTFTFNAKGEFVSVKDTAAAASSEPSERRANVVIEKLDITPYREAGLFSLMVVLRNRGSVPSPKFDVDYCRGSAGSKGDSVDGREHQAGPIEPGKSQSAASLPFSVKEGLNEFFVEIDPGSEVPVEDASDHRATLRVRVKDGKVLGLSTGTYDAAGSADAGGGGGQSIARTMRPEGELTFRDLVIRLVRINENDVSDKGDDSVEMVVRTSKTTDRRTIEVHRSVFVDGYEINVTDAETSSAAGQSSARIEIRYRPNDAPIISASPTLRAWRAA